MPKAASEECHHSLRNIYHNHGAEEVYVKTVFKPLADGNQRQGFDAVQELGSDGVGLNCLSIASFGEGNSCEMKRGEGREMQVSTPCIVDTSYVLSLFPPLKDILKIDHKAHSKPNTAQVGNWCW